MAAWWKRHMCFHLQKNKGTTPIYISSLHVSILYTGQGWSCRWRSCYLDSGALTQGSGCSQGEMMMMILASIYVHAQRCIILPLHLIESTILFFSPQAHNGHYLAVNKQGQSKSSFHPIITYTFLIHSLTQLRPPLSFTPPYTTVHMTKTRDNDCHFVFVKEELDHAGCVAIKDLHHGHFLQ